MMRKWSRHRAAILAAFAALLPPVAGTGSQELPPMKETVTFFYYEDVETAAAFYAGVLQLVTTMDEDWVKIFRITATSSVGLVQQGRGFHEVAADKPVMLSMVTDDVDSWYERVLAAKVKVQKELPAPNSEGQAGAAPIRGFVVEDPGGYTIEIFSWRISP